MKEMQVIKHLTDRHLLSCRYNQLDPLLRSTVNPEGDVNDATTGYSPYPGNINQLIFSIPDYDEQLRRTQGHVPEFVNPKYTDGTKTSFKSPTRLECMMQVGYPHKKWPPLHTTLSYTPSPSPGHAISTLSLCLIL